MIVKFKLFYYLLLTAVFTIPLSQQVSAGLIIITCLFSFFARDIQQILTSLLRNAWDILFYLIVLVFGLLFSEDLISGLKVIESNLSFLAVPIIFGRLEGVSGEKLSGVFYAFAGGLCAACLICLVNAGITYSQTNDIQSFFFYNLTNVLDFQPTYYAYYLIFVIAIGLYKFYYQTSGLRSPIIVMGLIFLFLMLILTGGQTAFVSIVLIFSFFILRFLIEEKNRMKNLTAALIAVMIACMFLVTLIQKSSAGWELNDAWDRLVLWESAIDAVPNLFIGVGTGDYKTVLHDYYLAHNLEKFANEYYNSHNQFIQLLFSNGVLGVIALILLIARPLYLSVINNNVVGILIFFPFLIYGMTEVFLGRYQGIVFFALIHQFFIIQLKSQNPFSQVGVNLEKQF
jgi:O-antigen ligase